MRPDPHPNPLPSGHAPSRSTSDAPRAPDEQRTSARELGLFGRYLTVWVALGIAAGLAIGQRLPVVPETLARFAYAQVSIPVAILVWLMIYPMMVQIDFSSVLRVRRQPKGRPSRWP